MSEQGPTWDGPEERCLEVAVSDHGELCLMAPPPSAPSPAGAHQDSLPVGAIGTRLLDQLPILAKEQANLVREALAVAYASGYRNGTEDQWAGRDPSAPRMDRSPQVQALVAEIERLEGLLAQVRAAKERLVIDCDRLSYEREAFRRDRDAALADLNCLGLALHDVLELQRIEGRMAEIRELAEVHGPAGTQT